MATIAIAGIMHESNTFCNTPTDFEAFSCTIGDDILPIWKDTHHEIGGFIHGAVSTRICRYVRP